MTYDDEHLGRMVRDVASEWTIPAQRLDRPTWRDRVRRGPATRTRLARWKRPVTGAAGLALALMVGVAALAVVLNTRPPRNPAAQGPLSTTTNTSTGSPAATRVQSPRASDGPTPGPSLAITGVVPSVTNVVVEDGNGAFARTDIIGNELTPLVRASRDSFVAHTSDGSPYCICVAYSGVQASKPTRAKVTYLRFDANGQQRVNLPLGEYVGAPDPRDAAGIPEEPEHVRVAVTAVPGQSFAYLGWSVRNHPVWKSAVEVVDVDAGTIVSSYVLPDADDGQGNARRISDAPRVVGLNGDELVVARPFYEFAPATSSTPSYDASVEVFTFGPTDISASDPKPVAEASDCGVDVVRAGGLADGAIWLECVKPNGQSSVIRIDASGTVATQINGPGEIVQGNSVVSPDGTRLYVWNPVSLRLTSVDLTNLDVTFIDAGEQGSIDILRQLGHMLVPSASAKVLLNSAVALSPDGTTLYALGVTGSSIYNSGSSGLYSFKLGETMSYARWQPVADFVSVAVSQDGRWVYAAGMPDAAVDGTQTEQPASIAVYDASNGDLVQLADDLGRDMILFPEQILP